MKESKGTSLPIRGLLENFKTYISFVRSLYIQWATTIQINSMYVSTETGVPFSFLNICGLCIVAYLLPYFMFEIRKDLVFLCSSQSPRGSDCKASKPKPYSLKDPKNGAPQIYYIGVTRGLLGGSIFWIL